MAALAAAIFALSFPGGASATTLAPAIGTSGNATLQFQPIPEPQTWVTAFAGLGTLIAMQRFRRTRAGRKP